MSAVIDTLAVKVGDAIRRERADEARISAEYQRTGAFITGQAAQSCAHRAEALEDVLALGGAAAAAGEVAVAECILRGALGDKDAARLARRYTTDAALAAAREADQ